MSLQILNGHALEVLRSMPRNLFHVGVTSPPYFQQRDYPVEPVLWNHNRDSISWVGNLGKEPLLDCMAWARIYDPCNTCYICHLRAIMQEVRRVMRPDGVFFLNIGDGRRNSKKFQPGVQETDLLGIPWRVALALQNDGWGLKSCIDLVKICPFPQSMEGWHWEQHRLKVRDLSDGPTTGYGRNSGRRDGDSYYGVACNPKVEWEDCPGCDLCSPNGGFVLMKGSGRPTDATEVLLVLTASQEYFWNSEGNRVPLAEASLGRAKRFKYLFEETGRRVTGASKYSGSEEEMSGQHSYAGFYANRGDGYNSNGRNAWNWMETIDIEGWLRWLMEENLEDAISWLEWSPESYKGDHYAAFPSFIPRFAIRACTSPAGVCANCGLPWAPMLRKTPGDRDDSGRTHRLDSQVLGASAPPEKGWLTNREVVGYRACCTCNAGRVQPQLLDPFCGSGTSVMVAGQEGINATGIELSQFYTSLAKSRSGILELAGREAGEWLETLS